MKAAKLNLVSSQALKSIDILADICEFPTFKQCL